MSQERFKEQLDRMTNDKGFIAALDQSGGSTPGALEAYGVGRDEYDTEDEMFDLVHEMRTRIITSPSFDSDYIIGAILFEQTMDREIEGKKSSLYLWEDKHVVPFLKVDKGKEDKENGVQLMKPIPGLDETLDRAKSLGVFGTKMRSVIYEYNEKGIADIIKQQFDYGRQIAAKGLVPILEPEVDIHSENKAKIESFMLEQVYKNLEDNWDDETPIMFKFTIPTEPNLYKDLIARDNVVRVVALSGGYSLDKAAELLAQNEGLIASFSRAFAQNLNVDQTEEEFDKAMAETSKIIYEASVK